MNCLLTCFCAAAESYFISYTRESEPSQYSITLIELHEACLDQQMFSNMCNELRIWLYESTLPLPLLLDWRANPRGEGESGLNGM